MSVPGIDIETPGGGARGLRIRGRCNPFSSRGLDLRSCTLGRFWSSHIEPLRDACPRDNPIHGLRKAPDSSGVE